MKESSQPKDLVMHILEYSLSPTNKKAVKQKMNATASISGTLESAILNFWKYVWFFENFRATEKLSTLSKPLG